MNQPVAGTNSADGGALGPEFDALLTGIGIPGKLPWASCCASDDVTVVLETCREPELRRPLEAIVNKIFRKKIHNMALFQ